MKSVSYFSSFCL